jgi:UDP-glucose 4-epimerase
MRIVVTGSAGHLGEALMRKLPAAGHVAVGVDRKPSPFTHCVGSIADRGFVARCLNGADAVIHSATLHKPHVATHSRQDFVDTNITGTLNLLEESASAKLGAFVFTSTTSVFGDALTDAVWITEDVTPIPKNVYSVTKFAAEHLCLLFHRKYSLPCLILRTARFFPEMDDSREIRENYADDNAKANEFLYRRCDLEDVVDAHILAAEKAHRIGHGLYIVSATSPFEKRDIADLKANASAVVTRYFPGYQDVYASRDWRMFPEFDRVYVNERARKELGWQPRYDFARILEHVRAGEDFRSPLAREVGSKGYHDTVFKDGPYPV